MNTVLYQHNRLKIKLSSQTAPDETTQSMICVFDNDVFKRGITLKSSDLTFKYQLFTDNLGNLIVSGNTSVYLAAPSYYVATTAKIYVGTESTKTYPSNMLVHELLLYESTSDNIAATSTNISTYFTSRHTLSTYTDTHNAYLSSWVHALSKGARTGSITVTCNAVPRGGAFTALLDNAYSGGPYGSGSCVGEYYLFDFGAGNNYVINGFKLFCSGLTNLQAGRIGYFSVQGSADNSNWTTFLTDFIWCDITSPNGTNLVAQTSDSDLGVSFSSCDSQTRLFTNSTAYRYYRFIGNNGNWNDSPYYHEMCFKIG